VADSVSFIAYVGVQEVGEELHSSRIFPERIFAACYSSALNRTAISGDSGIKVVDMNGFTELTSDTIKLTDAEVGSQMLQAWTA
jgi:hypothetical protein